MADVCPTCGSPKRGEYRKPCYPKGHDTWHGQAVDQLSLDEALAAMDEDLLEPPPPVGQWDTIQARFEQFHRLNPDVYAKLVELARTYQRAGYPRVGIGHLTEILRWQRRMDTYDPASEFKLSNDYRSRYARHIMANEPDLDGFITTRELRSA